MPNIMELDGSSVHLLMDERLVTSWNININGVFLGGDVDLSYNSNITVSYIFWTE